MKKVLVMVALVMVSVIVYAFNDKAEASQGKKEVTGNGEVVVMNKEMFLKDVFDYEKSKEWKYKGDKPAIIDLYADWCGPCRMLGPVLEKAAESLPDGVQIVKYNVDDCQDVASQLGVRGIPTLAVYKDGQLQAQQAGAMNSAQFSEFLKNFI